MCCTHTCCCNLCLPPLKGCAKNNGKSFFCPPFVSLQKADRRTAARHKRKMPLACDIEKSVSVCTLEKTAREIGFSPCRRGFEFSPAELGVIFICALLEILFLSLSGVLWRRANKSVEWEKPFLNQRACMIRISPREKKTCRVSRKRMKA